MRMEIVGIEEERENETGQRKTLDSRLLLSLSSSLLVVITYKARILNGQQHNTVNLSPSRQVNMDKRLLPSSSRLALKDYLPEVFSRSSSFFFCFFSPPRREISSWRRHLVHFLITWQLYNSSIGYFDGQTA